MSRRRLLDLFCGAGGASAGYHRAGFEVVGVDNEPHPDYPFEMIVADATTFPLDGFDAYAGSPPCHDHSSLRHGQAAEHGTAWMLAHTIARFRATGRPWVVENVDSADLAGELRIVLCGSQFGLGTVCRDGVYRQLRRHRQFASNVLLLQPGRCRHKGEPIGVYGNGGPGRRDRAGIRADTGRRAGYQGYRDECPAAMGIDWMKHHDLAQAIPPAYTEYIGHQLLEAMEAAA
jgi:DNA (cytosine-5)-methyltransferase 1